MTPGINIAKRKGIVYTVHEYIHEPSAESYGQEAALKMGVEEAKVFKTLVVELESKELVVGVIPVSSMLNLKSIAKAAGAKKATMADKKDVERATGYVLGGVSPLGQKKRLRAYIDSTALDHTTIFVSAGRRGLEIELSPRDLVILVSGVVDQLCQ